MRICIDPDLFEYIERKKFTDNHNNWTKEDLLDAVGRLVMNHENLSSIDGFLEEHDAMIWIPAIIENHLSSSEENPNINWDNWTEKDEKIYSMVNS